MKKNFSATIVLVPSAGGIYDVDVDGTLLFSKHQAGRFAEPEEIITLIRNKA